MRGVDGPRRRRAHDRERDDHADLVLREDHRFGVQLHPHATEGHRPRARHSNADTLARFRGQISSTKHPPGPTDTWLGEALIHSEDIRRPLGIAHDYPTDAAVVVADFYKGSNLVVGAKKRVAGLHLTATDAPWENGEGPEVSGPVMALVMVMTGRTTALDDLSGDGVATLQQRM